MCHKQYLVKKKKIRMKYWYLLPHSNIDLMILKTIKMITDSLPLVTKLYQIYAKLYPT